jgi:hypothetical protein
MSQFSPVAPVGILEYLDDLGIMGEYHLLIADKVLNSPGRWKQLFDGRRERGFNDFIMMDNSLIELGRPLPPELLVQAVEIVHANTIVLPDSYGQMEETVERSIVGAEILKDMLPDYCTFQFVVQGTSVAEALEGIRMIGSYVLIPGVSSLLDAVTHLSVPRVFCDTTGSRKRLIEELYARFGKKIHLLGFSENICDDVESAQLRGVTGIDSAMPIWAGMKQAILPKQPTHSGVDGLRRPSDYWTWGAQEVAMAPEVIMNLFRVNRWLGNDL